MKDVLKLGDIRNRVDISVGVYNSIQKFIVSVLTKKGEISFNDLLDNALRSKRLKFEGDLFWCLMQVKRDMVTRGVIEVNIGLGRSRTQTIRLLEKKPSSMKLVK